MVAKLLESFSGFVEHTDEDTAYLTFRAVDGEILHGECPLEELRALNIVRRFDCEVLEDEQGVRCNLFPLPDLEISEEIWLEIQETTRKMLGDEDDF